MLNQTAVILLALPVVAGAGALFPGYVEVGGYGEAGVKYSQLGENDNGYFLGGGGGLVLDGHVIVGADFAKLMDDIEYTLPTGELRFIEYSMLNLRLGYVFAPENTIHFALAVDSGLGWIKLRNPNKATNERDPDADTVFQVQPLGEVLLNLTKSSRLSLAAGYRWVSGVNTDDISNEDATGAYVELGVSFGAF